MESVTAAPVTTREKTGLASYPPEVWMFAIALLVRVLLLMTASFVEGADDLSFRNEISHIANSLATGHGYSSPFGGETGPTAWLPPVYPALCAVVFKILGGYGLGGIIGVLGMNSIFSALTCIPIFRIGERIFSRRIGFWSGWLWALVPYFGKWSVTWVWETTLSTFLMTWMLWELLELRRIGTEGQLRCWAAFGLLFGVAMLTNPAVLTVAALGFLWLIEEGGWQVIPKIVLSCMVCGLLIAPWLIRNRMEMHNWIFIRSNFAFEFSQGNFHGSLANCPMTNHPWANEDEFNRYAALGEAEYVRQRGVQAMQFVREYPGEMARLSWRRFLGFWDGRAMLLRPAWRQIWLPWLYFPLTITTVLGVVLMYMRRIPETNLLFLILFLYPWPYYLVCVQTRFRHLIDPLILVITVYLFAEVGQAALNFARNRRFSLPVRNAG